MCKKLVPIHLTCVELVLFPLTCKNIGTSTSRMRRIGTNSSLREELVPIIHTCEESHFDIKLPVTSNYACQYRMQQLCGVLYRCKEFA